MNANILTAQIELLQKVKCELLEFESDNPDKIMKMFQYSKLIEFYKFALMYIYDNVCHYGHHNIFFDEGDSIPIYDMFCLNMIKHSDKMPDDLIKGWKVIESVLLNACNDSQISIIKSIVDSLKILKLPLKNSKF